MTGLLPETMREVIGSRSVFAASGSSGIVLVITLLIVLVEREVIRAFGNGQARVAVLSAVAVPLLIAFVLLLVARIASVIPA